MQTCSTAHLVAVAWLTQRRRVRVVTDTKRRERASTDVRNQGLGSAARRRRARPCAARRPLRSLGSGARHLFAYSSAIRSSRARARGQQGAGAVGATLAGGLMRGSSATAPSSSWVPLACARLGGWSSGWVPGPVLAILGRCSRTGAGACVCGAHAAGDLARLVGFRDGHRRCGWRVALPLARPCCCQHLGCSGRQRLMLLGIGLLCATGVSSAAALRGLGLVGGARWRVWRRPWRASGRLCGSSRVASSRRQASCGASWGMGVAAFQVWREQRARQHRVARARLAEQEPESMAEPEVAREEAPAAPSVAPPKSQTRLPSGALAGNAAKSRTSSITSPSAKKREPAQETFHFDEKAPTRTGPFQLPDVSIFQAPPEDVAPTTATRC